MKPNTTNTIHCKFCSKTLSDVLVGCSCQKSKWRNPSYRRRCKRLTAKAQKQMERLEKLK